MATAKIRYLDTYPRPPAAVDTGWGMYLWTKTGNSAFWGKYNISRDQSIDILQKMKMPWVHMLFNGDNAVQVVPAFVEAGFEVVMRPYKFGSYDVCPPSEYAEYARLGVHYMGPYQNEIDSESGRPPSDERITNLAQAAISHADNCFRAGLIPLLPAFEGDRLVTWVLPMLKKMIDLGRKDVITGSIINGHFRPGSYYGRDRRSDIPEDLLFPPDIEPRQSDGRPGFCFRSYEMWIDAIKELLGMDGWCPPLMSTEFGYEPSDVRNNLIMQGDLNAKLATMSWLPELFCGMYWEWLPDWGSSHIWRGSVDESPMVRRFIDLPLQHTRLPLVTPPAPPDITYAQWSSWPELRPAVQAAAELAGQAFPLLDKDAAAITHSYMPTSPAFFFDLNGLHFVSRRYGMGPKAIALVRRVEYNSQSECLVVGLAG